MFVQSQAISLSPRNSKRFSGIVGRRLGIRRQAEESESERSNLGTIEAAVFALFGLVVAFTFSGAADRFNQKRALIAEEANDIGTAYLRLQLLSEKGPTGASRAVPSLS